MSIVDGTLLRIRVQLRAQLYDCVRGTKYDCLCQVPEEEFQNIKKEIIGILNEFAKKIKKTSSLVEPPIEYEVGLTTPVCVSLCTDEGNDLLY